MASLAAELQSLADLKAKGVLTEDEFTHAKAAVIAGDDAADSFEEAGADAVPVKAAGGIGYMTFWSEAFTLHEKFMNIPKDHNLEWRQHLAWKCHGGDPEGDGQRGWCRDPQRAWSGAKRGGPGRQGSEE